jgi:5-methylcytosine-specific restriction enzyme A
MPIRAKTPCNKPGCPSITDGRFCVAHKDEDRKWDKESRKRADLNRPGARLRGYNARWDKARIVWLNHHPLCVYCLKQGRTTAARVVDHITPHRMNMDLFWDSENNWQSLCIICHNRKSAGE